MELVLFRYSKSGLVSFRFNYTIDVEIGTLKSFQCVFAVQSQLWLTVVNCNYLRFGLVEPMGYLMLSGYFSGYFLNTFKMELLD